MKHHRLLERVILDFVIGGGTVAAALVVAILTTPLLGGLIAALPVRLGTTIALGSVRGEAFTSQMIEGSLLTYFATLGFLLILWWGQPKFGLAASLGIASVVAIVILLATFKVAGKF